jgi:hypothetical protein
MKNLFLYSQIINLLNVLILIKVFKNQFNHTSGKSEEKGHWCDGYLFYK